MQIGLHDAERDTMPKKIFPNFALMKISAFHKAQGDGVEWWNGLIDKKYDLVYSSSVFDFTPKNKYLPLDTIYGGTGYGLYGELPAEIDNMFPDYSIYPACDYAIGFLTRGCINDCSYCIVPRKEGVIRPYCCWQDIVRKDTNKLHLMDNNILACYLIDLNQGMDITLLSDDICKIISEIKWDTYIRFSCDKEYQIPYFEKAVKMFNRHNIPKSKIFIYLLVQKDLGSAEFRLRALHDMCHSFSIYAQAERNSLLGVEPNDEQLEFAQRYVYGRSYKRKTWREYLAGLNHRF